MAYEYNTSALLTNPKKKIATPIRLTPETLKAQTVTVQGFKFLNFGATLVCPECGKISGFKATRALDNVVDYFLIFGCEHYKNDKDLTEKEKKALEDTPDNQESESLEGEIDEDDE